MVDEKLVKLITERVIEKIREYQTYKIPIGVSNRHVHVTKEDLEILYGPGYELTKKGDLKQPVSSLPMRLLQSEDRRESLRMSGSWDL